MVQSIQLSGSFRCFDSSINARHYWKIDSGLHVSTKELLNYLQSKHYTCKSRGLTRLRQLYIHSQRGFMSYEGLSVAELARFAASRGLPPMTDKKRTRSILKAQLEQADDDATFDRFIDLPAELRCLIYDHYFHSLERPSPIGSQPPITRISRHTRDEALPLFYSSSIFTLFGYNLATLTLDWASKRFVTHTLAHHFARIKFLDFSFAIDLREGYKLLVKIGIDGQKCFAKVTKVEISRSLNYPICEEGIQQRMAALQKIDGLLMTEQNPFVKDVTPHVGWAKLQKDDVTVLLEEVGESVNKVLRDVQL